MRHSGSGGKNDTSRTEEEPNEHTQIYITLRPIVTGFDANSGVSNMEPYR